MPRLGLEGFDPLATPAAPASFDVVLDCVAVAATLAGALAAVVPTGRVVLVDLDPLIGRCTTLDDAPGAFEAYAEGRETALKILVEPQRPQPSPRPQSTPRDPTGVSDGRQRAVRRQRSTRPP